MENAGRRFQVTYGEAGMATLEPRIFVSYSSADGTAVREVVAELKKRGLDLWFDQQSISFSDSIASKINEGLKESKYFVLFASRSYFSKTYPTAEYEAFLHLALGSNERKIFVVAMEDLELPPLLRYRRTVKWSSAPQIADEVFSAISSIDRTQVSEEAVEKAAATMERGAGELVPWQDVQSDLLVDVLAQQLLKYLGDLLTRREEIVPLTVAIPPNLTITLQIARVLLENDSVTEEIRGARERRSIAQRMVNGYNKQLIKGGLGIFLPAFEVAMEEQQKALDEARRQLRGQLEAISPKILVRRSISMRADPS